MSEPQCLRLIDLEVVLPTDAKVTSICTPECRLHHRLSGADLRELREAIEIAGTGKGYSLERSERVSSLARPDREQTIGIVADGATRLDITVDDPEVLPFASFGKETVVVGDVVVRLPGVLVVPRRERLDRDSGSRIAEWEVYGVDAEAVSLDVLGSLEAAGLKATGIFRPRNPVVGDTWITEAVGAGRIVKGYATQRSPHVLLQLVLVELAPGGQGD